MNLWISVLGSKDELMTKTFYAVSVQTPTRPSHDGRKGERTRRIPAQLKNFFREGRPYFSWNLQKDRVWLFEDLTWQESKPLPNDFGWNLPRLGREVSGGHLLNKEV